jgi:hypothetical protein
MPTTPALQGRVFGRLTVLDKADTTGSGKRRWRCRCECGQITLSSTGNLRSGNSTSCGQCCRKTTRTHGHFTGRRMSPTYAVWHGMKQRCTNPNFKQWKDYGGRGIKVCKRWQAFENFLADMGEKPPKLQIDRIDNNGDYKPSNCRWVTPKENSATRRRK